MLLATTNILAQLFVQPLQVPTEAQSLLWAGPLCLSIALVYKALKIENFTPALYVREVALLFATIIGFLIVVALVLLATSHLAGQ